MIENNITPIVVVLGALLLMAVALIVYLFWRTRRIEADNELLMRGSDGRNFVQIVSDNIAQVEVLLSDVGRLSEQYAQVLRRMAGAVQHVGVVRFDAFRDLGGLLSFAVALLDDRGNGLVFSSIYGRTESRTYAKPVVERSSTYELSPEEKEAIRLAMQSKELGALPVEARDREHEERMANLRLFHDREYLQRSNHAEEQVEEARRRRTPEERRAPRRPLPEDEEKREERPPETPRRQVRVRSKERAPAQPRRGPGRVSHVGPPAERPSRPDRADREPAGERDERTPERAGEPDATRDEPGEETGQSDRSPERDRREESEQPGRRRQPQRPARNAPRRAETKRTAGQRSRGLNTPIERLRNREPRGE